MHLHSASIVVTDKLAILLYIIAVSVIWNGTVIDGPILIYHDEILLDHDTIPTVENSNDPGDLVCRSENHEEANWHNSNGFIVPKDTDGNYRQVNSAAGSVPSLSRLSTPNQLIGNGLWICQVVNAGVLNILDSFNYVGIYNRGDGEEAVQKCCYSG